MTKYAKLISENKIEFAPKNKGAIMNYNLNVSELKKDGYKEFVEAEKEIGKSYTITYTETKTKIKEITTEIIPDPQELLRQAKEAKITENDEKRDIALNQGVLYKDILFDSDTDQKVNLLATITTMADDDSIIWFGKDNQPLLCTKQDLVNIGSLITDLHTFCWTTNARIKGLIDSSQTIAEVEAIEINYEQGE